MSAPNIGWLGILRLGLAGREEEGEQEPSEQERQRSSRHW